MQQILSEIVISGIYTNLLFLSRLVESKAVQENEIYTRYIDDNLDLINTQIQEKKLRLNRHKWVIAYLVFHFQQKNNPENSVWNQLGYWRMMPQIEVSLDGKKYNCRIETGAYQQLFRINEHEYKVSSVKLDGNLLKMEIDQWPETFYCLEDKNQTQVILSGFSFLLRSNSLMSQVLLNRKNTSQDKIFQNLICADLFGKVLKLNISNGDAVQAGQILLTLESMKTEIHVLCPVNARVKLVHVKEGNSVIEKQLMVELEENCYEVRDTSCEF